MSGLGSGPVAGAGLSKMEAPHVATTKAPRLTELNPDATATIRFYYHKDEQQDLATLLITYDYLGIKRKFSIAEKYDSNLHDVVLEVRLDDDLLAIYVEPEETPWFFDHQYLEKEIARDRRQTFISILRYFTWPFESLETEVGG